MKKIKVTVVAEFEVPDHVILHDSVFETEGVFFHPEIHFDCIEIDPYSPEDPLRFPNDIESIEEYEIKNINMESNVEYMEESE
jgi:hypothetical protein